MSTPTTPTRRRSSISRFHPLHAAPAGSEPIMNNLEIDETGEIRPRNVQVNQKQPNTQQFNSKVLTDTPATAQPKQQTKKNPLAIVGVIAFYFAASLTTIFLNKYLLSSEFKDTPVFFTWVQTVFAIFASWIFSMLSTLCCSKKPTTDAKTDDGPQQASVLQQFLAALPVSLLFTLMLIFGNVCLSFIHISFYQVARSWTCIISIILSFFFFGSKPSLGQIFSCCIVVAGYILACDSEIKIEELLLEFKELSLYIASLLPNYQGEVIQYQFGTQNKSIVLGIISGLLSSFMLALYSIMNKKIQNRKMMTNNQLVFWLNTNSALMMFAYMWYTQEFQRAIQKEVLYQSSTYIPMLIVSLSGFSLNFATVLQIQYTSPLAHTISGTAKASVQSAIGWYLAPNPVPTMGMVGTLLTIAGCFLYGFF